MSNLLPPATLSEKQPNTPRPELGCNQPRRTAKAQTGLMNSWLVTGEKGRSRLEKTRRNCQEERERQARIDPDIRTEKGQVKG